VIELGGRATTYGGTLPFRNPLRLLALQAMLSRIGSVVRSIPKADPWTARDADRLDGATVETWRRSIPSGRGVRSVVDSALRTVFGADPSELSMLHFLWYLSSNGGLMRLVETAGGYQQDRIAGGTQQISERLADAVGRDRILLEHPVSAVRQDDSGVTIEAAGRSLRAKEAIVSVPLALAGRIAYEPLLPPMRDQIHQRVAMGSTVKVFALYDRPFWRERGYSGEAVGTSGLVAVAFDNTPKSGAPACLLSFIVGRPARTFASLAPERRRSSVLDELVRFFGPEAQKPAAYVEMDWGEERFTGGCPVGNFPPGTLSIFGPALRAPVGRIHWCGTEIAGECTGYMEGALESGERAAAGVLARH
jgi:monoamine oxidase